MEGWFSIFSSIFSALCVGRIAHFCLALLVSIDKLCRDRYESLSGFFNLGISFLTMFKRSIFLCQQLGIALAISCLCLSAQAAPTKAKTKTKKAASKKIDVSSTVSNSSGEKILKIDVQGNKKIDREAILEKIASVSGGNLSTEQVRKDISAIHKLGYFDDIQADFEGGTLKFTVKERPAIYRIVFFGNDQISTDDLKGALTIKTYDIYDENLVRESVRKLTKYYEDKGFYLAKVDYSVRASKEKDMVELLFQVREYDKVKIRKITFLGNSVFSDDQLKRVLRNTSEGGFFSWASNSGNFKELDFKNDMQMLQLWYLNEGYVRFRNEPPIVTVSEDKKWVFITIKVDEGKRYKMSTIDFSGDLLFPKEELNETITLKEGDYFSITKRNNDILALTEKYQDLGYANVNVVPNLDIHDDSLTVSTNYEFEKGTLVHFGRITIKGNTKTRDKVIRRELKIHEGELYSGSGMRVSKENVERLGFFETEGLAFTTKSPPGRPDILDVEIQVKERPTGQFQLGAGYATTTRFFFTTQVSESNFMGKGQDLRFQAQLAADKKNKSFRLAFTDPYAFDTLWSMGGTLSYEVDDIPNKYVEFHRGFEMLLGHPVSEYSRFYLSYRLEELRLDNILDPVVAANQKFENGTISSVTGALVHDKRNNRMETSGGYYGKISEEYAGLGGNRNFIRSIVDGRFYHRILLDDLVFRMKMEGGSIYDTKPSDGIQSNEKFYLGGPNNLRGYAPFSVGPYKTFPDGSKIPSGAINQAFSMFELEYPIAREIGLKFVTFYDAGSAFDKLNKFRYTSNWGWGFRWFSPLGPLRFEWGYPIGKGKTADGILRDTSQFNFNIGSAF